MFGLRVEGRGCGRPLVGVFFSMGLVMTVNVGASARAEAQDVEAGRAIATQGVLAGHAACAACHLESGAGQAEAAIPRIGGVAASYIKQQLTFFASGQRPSAWMTQYAKQLSPKQIDDVAAYYAAQAPAVEAPRIATSAEQIAHGNDLYKKGNMSAHVMPCAGCHGPAGQGLGAMFPAIAGQSPSYVVQQLSGWKAGKDRDPMGKMMMSEVHGLTDEEIQALAAYIYTLPQSPGAAK